MARDLAPSGRHIARTSRFPARLLRVTAVVVAVAAILSATTFPATGTGSSGLSRCIVCGERGVADALLNILLFAPLGVALSLNRLRAGPAVLGAFVLSGLIETAQLLVIPGRDPSAGDLVFNSLGAMLGFALAASARWWMRPPAARAAALAWGWSTVVSAILWGTGLLLAPALPRAHYYGAWTPTYGHLEWYNGRVLEARLDSSRLRDGRLADSGTIRELLIAGSPLRVVASAGLRPVALAPVIAIHDADQHEILIFGIDGDDLVFRYRTRARALLLDQPDLRSVGLMRGVVSGNSMRLAAWRDDGALCLQRDDAIDCGIGFTVSRGWGTLMYVERLPPWLMRALDLGWLLCLFAPLGFWLRRDARVVFALAPAYVALLHTSRVTVLLPTRLGEVVLSVVAVVLGALMSRLAHRDRATRSEPA